MLQYEKLCMLYSTDIAILRNRKESEEERVGDNLPEWSRNEASTSLEAQRLYDHASYSTSSYERTALPSSAASSSASMSPFLRSPNNSADYRRCTAIFDSVNFFHGFPSKHYGFLYSRNFIKFQLLNHFKF